MVSMKADCKDPPSDDDAHLNIAQLAERSGVKVPTIHYYRRLGLLPEPVRLDEHRFRYGPQHVQALQLIRLLRQRRHLPLPAIAEVLPALLAADQEAFRPEMWDQVVTSHLTSSDDQPRQNLVAAARQLFSERGFAAVSIEDLCGETGLAKGSFYRLFESKEAIYAAAVQSLPGAVAAELHKRRVKPDAAADRLARRLAAVLSPVLPLLLEASVRALHGTTGRDVVAETYDQLRHIVSEWIAPAGDMTLAVWVLAHAVQRVLMSTLGVPEPRP
jgi:AcrR family transcriptional regulator/predicted DNA-binding transcriptional regulator AlpA